MVPLKMVVLGNLPSVMDLLQVQKPVLAVPAGGKVDVDRENMIHRLHLGIFVSGS